MNKREMANALNAHADALNRGEDLGNELLARYPNAAGELAELFQLAEQLRATLVPVAVPAFKERLRHELETFSPAEVVIGRSRSRQKRWLAFAAAGSALSVIGISLVVLRHLRGAGGRSIQPATTVA